MNYMKVKYIKKMVYTCLLINIKKRPTPIEEL